MRSKVLIGGAIATLGLVGLLAWHQRDTLQAWYYVHRFQQADAGDRERWAERIVSLGPTAVPHLIRSLRKDDTALCSHVQKVLVLLAGRDATLPIRLAGEFDRLSSAGQLSVLDLWLRILPERVTEESNSQILGAMFQSMSRAGKQDEAEVRLHALRLAGALLDRIDSPQLPNLARELVRAGLSAPTPAERIQAIALAVQPEVRMHEQVASMLHDPEATVRRSALVAIEAVPEAIRTVELLRWLHDPDEEARRLCEAALRCRGLSQEHIQRGRWLTDPRPKVRLQVLDDLASASDLEPGVWLRHLSHDTEPAVRAAAVRVAAEQSTADLTDRLEQMARDDPSPTVRQLCRFYLSQRRS